MQLPEQLLQSLESVKGFDKEAFDRVHQSGEQVTSVRFNPFKSSVTNLGDMNTLRIHDSQLTTHNQIPWCNNGFYLESRPSFTFDPLFHAGTYYVQEASSMFLEQALKQTVDFAKPLKVLDLCASPGGKSTHIQSLLSKDSLLVSNEVIRSRANVLKDNIIKWGSENVVVTNNDPKDFAALENYFDVIVVDAPCSGSGLFRRDEEAIEEWSENNVALCSQRQQRILADVWPSLKKEGILIYSTCSYSKEEDEEIIDWISAELLTANCQLRISSEWGITETTTVHKNTGYRFWPYKVKGEGFFLACFQKKEGGEEAMMKTKKKPEPLTKNELALLDKWVHTEGAHFIKHLSTVYAWSQALVEDFTFLLNQLKVLYSGTIIGELMRDKLIPDHALAMSKLVQTKVGRVELTKEEAIRYLQRKDIQLETTNKGWQLACYNGFALGWMNVLPNRINNYYPKELRILKERE